ncbi:VOC family protein [Acidisoma sp. 7E03]
MPTFASTRLVTTDIHRLVDFYAKVTGLTPLWRAPVFAELPSAGGTLAIAAAETLALFGDLPIVPGTAGSAIIEFRVAEVDAEAARLAAPGLPVLQPPTTMPWGNRSMLLADPDGRLVNLFTPVTAEARSRLGEA